MGLLNHLFGSEESLAKEIKMDDESIFKIWGDYLKTIPKKKEVFESIAKSFNFERRSKGFAEGYDYDIDIKDDLQEFKKLLNLELADISYEEIEESELISDLEKIEHSQKVRRVHKLEQCLKYLETKYEYAYELLRHLYSILKYQAYLTEKLITGSKNIKIAYHLNAQLELEGEIIKKIEEIETFHGLFSALVKGEHIIRVMDAKEKELLKRMQERMYSVVSNKIKKGILYEWVGTVFDAIETKVDEMVANQILNYHADSDVEYVNRPEFIGLVRETIQNLRGRKASEQMINAFVHLFREWYNHEISHD